MHTTSLRPVTWKGKFKENRDKEVKGDRKRMEGEVQFDAHSDKWLSHSHHSDHTRWNRKERLNISTRWTDSLREFQEVPFKSWQLIKKRMN